MRGRLHFAKRIVFYITVVMMVGFLFSGCGKAPHDTPYTFRVASEADGERQWMVRLAKSGIVSYAIETEGDETCVVFTGLKAGSVDATVYHAPAGQTAFAADDVYVLTLKVDMRKNVTQPKPYYGAYTVRLAGDVAGSQWRVECSDERIVHWEADREYPKKSTDEDGMQDFTQLYTFTGRHPGAAHVRICVSYPWAEGAESVREDFWLLVDAEYRVSRLEPTDFESFTLSETGMRAAKEAYEAKRTADGVQLSHYFAMSHWSEEKNDYVEERTDETVIDGGEELYMYLAGLTHACDMPGWDGFSGSDPHVLDGTMFTFRAKLADGTQVYATGSNAYPKRYHAFRQGLSSMIKLYGTQNETE